MRVARSARRPPGGLTVWGRPPHHAGAFLERRYLQTVAASPALERLIQPMALDQFMSAHFSGGEWLLAPHSNTGDGGAVPSWVASHFSLLDLHDLLASGIIPAGGQVQSKACGASAGEVVAHRLPRVRLTKSGASAGVQPGIEELVCSPDRVIFEVQDAFRGGRSVLVDNLGSVPGRVAHLAGDIARCLGLPVEASACLEPANGCMAEPPLGKPWPRFLLQVNGRRTWHLASDRVWGMPQQFAKQPLSKAASVTLKTGDVLYVPSHWPILAEPVKDGPSLYLDFSIHQHCFTWAALVSLVCRRIVLLAAGESPDSLELERERAVDADELDAVLFGEAGRVKVLGTTHIASAQLSGPRAGSLNSCLPAVLQHSVSVPYDLPSGFVDDLLRQLKHILRRLRRVGHLDQRVDLRVSAGHGRVLAAEAVSVRAVVEAAAAVGDSTMREALLWALAELRRRSAEKVSATSQSGSGEAFSSLTRWCSPGAGSSSRHVERALLLRRCPVSHLRSGSLGCRRRPI